MPWPSSTADAFRPQAGGADVGEAAHGCAVPGSGCHAPPSAAAPLRVIGDGATGERRIEPAASRDRLLGGRADVDVDGLVSWRAQERQKRSQKEEGKREEKKMIEQLVRSKRHWSTALPCLLSPHPCSLADVRARSSVLCDDVDFWSSSIMQLL